MRVALRRLARGSVANYHWRLARACDAAAAMCEARMSTEDDPDVRARLAAKARQRTSRLFTIGVKDSCSGSSSGVCFLAIAGHQRCLSARRMRSPVGGPPAQYCSLAGGLARTRDLFVAENSSHCGSSAIFAPGGDAPWYRRITGGFQSVFATIWIATVNDSGVFRTVHFSTQTGSGQPSLSH